MEQIIVVTILIAILVISLILYIYKSVNSKTKRVKSNYNNKEYVVQNLSNKEQAADILAIIHERIFIFNNYLQRNKDSFPDYKPYIERLGKKMDNLVLVENSPKSKYTSYTVNKGDEIALCLRSKQTGNIHDLNLIMYVVLHELAHIACPELDHTELFKKIFIFFLKVAITIGIYQKINYQINPHEYCGLTIREDLIQ